jgi:hypothetical protein
MSVVAMPHVCGGTVFFDDKRKRKSPRQQLAKLRGFSLSLSSPDDARRDVESAAKERGARFLIPS